MKTPEQWARDWNLPGIGGMVEAVRAEFATEAVAKLREEVVTASSNPREALCFGLAAAIVEALARPIGDGSGDHPIAPGDGLPKCHADCTYECCEQPPGRNPTMFTIAPDVTQGINTVDFRGVQPAMCACGIPVGKGHRDGCPTQPAECKHQVRELLAGLVCCQACGEVGL